jgi:hypothetical protein
MTTVNGWTMTIALFPATMPAFGFLLLALAPTFPAPATASFQATPLATPPLCFLLLASAATGKKKLKRLF